MVCNEVQPISLLMDPIFKDIMDTTEPCKVDVKNKDATELARAVPFVCSTNTNPAYILKRARGEKIDSTSKVVDPDNYVNPGELLASADALMTRSWLVPHLNIGLDKVQKGVASEEFWGHGLAYA